MDDLIKNINDCCRKIAERDGFELKTIGGYRLRENGLWEFVEGDGEYKLLNGEMQWILY